MRKRYHEKPCAFLVDLNSTKSIDYCASHGELTSTKAGVLNTGLGSRPGTSLCLAEGLMVVRSQLASPKKGFKGAATVKQFLIISEEQKNAN